LDEPPEPVICKCKDPTLIVNAISSKIRNSNSIEDVQPGMIIDTLAETNINPALIDTMSMRPTREVELRLVSDLSKNMFVKMGSGAFEKSTTTRTREFGCIC